MALVKCMECGGTVSTKPDMCPLCGTPVEGQTVGVVNVQISVTVEQEKEPEGWFADLLAVLGRLACFLWAVVRGCFKVFTLILLGGLIGATCGG